MSVLSRPEQKEVSKLDKRTDYRITAILQCIRLMGRVAVIEIPHPR